MKSIKLYTDGACSGNPGNGGWGAVLIYGNNTKEISGYEENTTNNKMEIQAVIEGLKCLKESCNVEIYSDSAYVVNAFTQGWIEKWKKTNWKTAGNKPVKNVERWQEMLNLLEKHNFKFIKVKGHADNEFNNKCDFLATSEIQKNSK